MFVTGETVGLAEWIIDDTCLVFFVLRQFKEMVCILKYNTKNFKMIKKPFENSYLIFDRAQV